MRLYVAGPVTGYHDLNRTVFDDAAMRLEEAGHAAIVPHRFVPPDADWQTAMRSSVKELVACDGVALLPGWRGSRGALIERDLARRIGMAVKTVDAWCG